MTTVFVPASFDPFTLGHSAIVEHAIERGFEHAAKRRGDNDVRVVIVVGTNPDKPSGMFDKDTRKRLIEFSIDDGWRNLIEIAEATLANEKVVFSRYKPDIIVRGYRNGGDLKLEDNLVRHWRDVQAEITGWHFDFCLFEAPEHLKDVSSTNARKIVAGEGNAQELHKLFKEHVAYMFQSVLIEHPAAGKNRELINQLVNERLAAAGKRPAFQTMSRPRLARRSTM